MTCFFISSCWTFWFKRFLQAFYFKEELFLNDWKKFFLPAQANNFEYILSVSLSIWSPRLRPPWSAAAPFSKTVLTKMGMSPCGDPNPPTIENPRLCWPLHKQNYNQFFKVMSLRIYIVLSPKFRAGEPEPLKKKKPGAGAYKIIVKQIII